MLIYEKYLVCVMQLRGRFRKEVGSSSCNKCQDCQDCPHQCPTPDNPSSNPPTLIHEIGPKFFIGFSNIFPFKILIIEMFQCVSFYPVASEYVCQRRQRSRRTKEKVSKGLKNHKLTRLLQINSLVES